MLLRTYIPVPAQIMPIDPNHPFLEPAHIDIRIRSVTQVKIAFKKDPLSIKRAFPLPMLATLTRHTTTRPG